MGYTDGYKSREISIHAPRVGSDYYTYEALETLLISIHAPRVGSDPTLFLTFSCSLYFNPRSPCGERHPGLDSVYQTPLDFNPRSPCGERHHLQVVFDQQIAISIHAPRVGSDGVKVPKRKLLSDFNPRSPCGERRSWHPAG